MERLKWKYVGHGRGTLASDGLEHRLARAFGPYRPPKRAEPPVKEPVALDSLRSGRSSVWSERPLWGREVSLVRIQSPRLSTDRTFRVRCSQLDFAAKVLKPGEWEKVID